MSNVELRQSHLHAQSGKTLIGRRQGRLRGRFSDREVRLKTDAVDPRTARRRGLDQLDDPEGTFGLLREELGVVVVVVELGLDGVVCRGRGGDGEGQRDVRFSEDVEED